MRREIVVERHKRRTAGRRAAVCTVTTDHAVQCGDMTTTLWSVQRALWPVFTRFSAPAWPRRCGQCSRRALRPLLTLCPLRRLDHTAQLTAIPDGPRDAAVHAVQYSTVQSTGQDSTVQLTTIPDGPRAAAVHAEHLAVDRCCRAGTQSSQTPPTAAGRPTHRRHRTRRQR